MEKETKKLARSSYIGTVRRSNADKIDAMENTPSSILIKIQGVRHRALIDSGAQLSIMHKKVYDSLKYKGELKRKNLHLTSVSGTPLKVDGTANITFKVGGLKLQHNFVVVSNMNRNFILGRDWLTENRVRIYFDLKSIRVQGHYIPFEQDIHIASLARLKNTIVLKPHTISVVKAKLKRRQYFSKGDTLMFSTTDLDRGYVSNELGLLLDDSVSILNDKSEIIVSVANITNKTIKLSRGCVIGKVNKVPEVDLIESEKEDKTASSDRTQVNVDEITVPLKFKERIKHLVNQNSDVFANSDLELGKTKTVEMNIDTENSPPIKVKNYRTPLQNREIVEKAIQNMLDAKVITRGYSEWSCPVILVKKRDNSMRFCCDYRKLNAVTKSVSYPLPNIDDVLSVMSGAKYFSTLDCRSGYWCVPMTEDAKKKSTFSCHLGSFQWNVMPFGLKNAPAKFMQLMDIVLGDMKEFAGVFIDDIVVFSSTLEDHFKHLQLVFDRLRKHQLKLKLSKCSFLEPETRFLGFVISEKGIKPDQEKVKIIKELTPPTNVKTARSFLGVIGFYRRYIPNFSTLATPIVELTKKYARFKWTPECQKAFDKLKEDLSCVPLLSFPDRNKPYILYTDSSDYAVGAALTQVVEEEVDGILGVPVEKPIQFISKKLSKAQTKWPVIEREAFAIFYALQKLDFYLHNSTFVIRTDHLPLKYIFESPMTNKKVHNWALSIASYDCTIEYCMGEKNFLADYFSRIQHSDSNAEAEDVSPDVNDNAFEINVINSNEIEPKLFARWENPVTENEGRPTLPSFEMKEEQEKDEELVEIMRKLRNETADKTTYRHFIMVDNILYYISGINDDPKLRLCIPKQLYGCVLEQYHDQHGHMGTNKVFTAIKIKYYWKNMFKDVHSYVANCVTCNKRNLTSQKPPMQQTDIPPFPFAKVSVDVSGPYPRTLSGNSYIVSYVDHFSLWAECFPTPDKTSETVANLLIDEIVPRFGCPLEIVTDNGPENIGKAMIQTLERLNVHHVKTSYYSPQSNARNERVHRTLHDMLSKKVEGNPDTWDIHLNSVLAAMRTNVNDSTQFSPFFLVYGRHPVLPLDNLLKPRLKYMGEERHELSLQEQHKAFVMVHRNVRAAQNKNKALADKKSHDTEYKIGDSVYYKNHNMTSKLDDKWKTHYIIIDKLSPVSFLLKNQLMGKITKAHARDIRLANLAWVEPDIDKATKSRRHANYVVLPKEPEIMDTKQSSSDEEQDNETPLNRMIKDKVNKIDNSSSEDDIPLMQLRRQILEKKLMNNKTIDDDTRCGEYELDTDNSCVDNPMEIEHVRKKKTLNKRKRRSNESSSEKVKDLLKAITSIL